MQAKIIDTDKGFNDLKDTWSQVLAQSATNHIFLTHEWLSAWWEDYGQGNRLFIIVVEDQDAVIAIAPLMITKGKKLQFIAQEISDYLDFIICRNRTECFEMIFRAIQDCPDWDWADLAYLPADSPNYEHWARSLAAIPAVRKSLGPDGVAIVLDLKTGGKQWTDIESSLPGKRRKDLKRCAKLLSREGDLELIRAKTYPEIAEQFRHFVENHRRRWGRSGGGSQFDDPRQVAHYLNVARKLSARGWMELSSLKLNEKYIAMAYGYTYEGRYYYYTPAFDPDYWKYSPGNLLIKSLIEAFYQDGSIEIFDLLRGDEDYKYVWSKKELGLYRAQIYPLKLATLCRWLTQRAASSLLPLLRKVPGLKKMRSLARRWGI